MTSDFGPYAGMPSEVVEPQPSPLVTGRMISLRFITAALRRRRRLWVGLTILGLVVGVGYRVAVPPKYQATATLYLAHPPGANDSVISANDLAMLSTVTVGQQAIAALGEHGLTPQSLLGKAPGTAVSDNVLTITIAGSTQAEAVRRANAVATAYLAFRSEQYKAQNDAVVSAANHQVTKLQTQVAQLTNGINQLGGVQSQEMANLIDQRASLSSQITNLQQSVQTDNLSTLTVAQGSRVLTPATPAKSSQVKTLLLDAGSGLIAGVAIGLLVVILQAVLSDRLRRREDIASVLGAPVDVSIRRPRRRPFRRLTVAGMTHAPGPDVRTMVHYLHDRMAKAGPRPTELLVALDDPQLPAAAAALLAAKLSSSGRKVVLVDATADRVLGTAFGAPRVGTQSIKVGGAPEVTMVVPPRPWEGDDTGHWEGNRADLANANAILVVATVDPSSGAWHLRRWGPDAVVTATAGACTAQRINAIAELLAAAEVSVSSAVLLGADANDDSVGFPDPVASAMGRRLGVVPHAQVMST